MTQEQLTKAVNINNKLQEKKSKSEELLKAKQANTDGMLTIGVFEFQIEAKTVSDMINDMYTKLLTEIQELEREFAEL